MDINNLKVPPCSIDFERRIMQSACLPDSYGSYSDNAGKVNRQTVFAVLKHKITPFALVAMFTLCALGISIGAYHQAGDAVMISLAIKPSKYASNQQGNGAANTVELSNHAFSKQDIAHLLMDYPQQAIVVPSRMDTLLLSSR